MSTLMAQEGMRVPGEDPPQEAANGPASGVIGGENATPAETVADDIPMDVPEGSFIINAAAAEVAGYGDIKKMIRMLLALLVVLVLKYLQGMKK